MVSVIRNAHQEHYTFTAMIHCFAVLKKNHYVYIHSQNKDALLLIFFTISSCLDFSTLLSLVGRNWVEPMQINSTGKGSSKKSVVIFIYPYLLSMLSTYPACKHYQHSAERALLSPLQPPS